MILWRALETIFATVVGIIIASVFASVIIIVGFSATVFAIIGFSLFLLVITVLLIPGVIVFYIYIAFIKLRSYLHQILPS